mgnify:CR=1 FL=1
MLTKDIQNNFPFLSVVNYGGKEYIGIVINQDASVTSMYVYTDLNTKKEQEKRKFERHQRMLSISEGFSNTKTLVKANPMDTYS